MDEYEKKTAYINCTELCTATNPIWVYHKQKIIWNKHHIIFLNKSSG